MKFIARRLFPISSSTLVLILGLIACSPAAPATPAPTAIASTTPVRTLANREAQVQTVEVQISQSNPPQVSAVVRGDLTESCASLGESQVHYVSNSFQITVYVNSPADIGCMQATAPFETTIPLNIKDLPAGNYTVIANGVSKVFTLPVEISTPTLEATSAPAATRSACIDSAAFVTDVTIPDDTILDSNNAFTKTWRLKNTGSCTWDSSYLVAYIWGATMSQQPGYWIMKQGQIITPGQTVDVSVGMISPVDNGNYVSYWGLKKVDGPFVPIAGGANGDSFYLKIKVNSGQVDGNVRAASIAIQPEQGSGPACTSGSTYLVHASITTNGASSVTYEIESSAGQTTAGYFQPSPAGPVSPSVTGIFVFDQLDTKTIDLRFVGPYPYPDNITVLLWVNHRDWYQAKLSCDSN